jgi:Set1/Ash2 histone methyltransferase complex subunit ASH2
MSSEPQPKRVIWVPPSVALSERDRAKQLVLSTDQMEVTGVNGGYRMNRATHGVHNGAYFWEVEVLPPAVADEAGVAVAVDPSQCHTRVGWSTRQGELQGPVGNDKHGFGYRDIAGSKVHGGERVDHYGADYGPGDIIGCFLYLDVDDVSNNQMRFFKNGHDQGVAYRGGEIPLGVYFPAVSVYMQAHVRVNFGPSFLLKHDIFGANAVSEVQPMNPEDRKAHDARIAGIRATNPACLALKAQGGSVGGVSL